jgi:hypothetical protein
MQRSSISDNQEYQYGFEEWCGRILCRGAGGDLPAEAHVAV